MRGMITGLLALLLLAACAAPPPAAPPPAGLDGDWRGTIEVPGAPLEIGVTFAGDGGTLDVPAQGLTGVPLAEVRTEGTAVTFTVPGLPGDVSFRGTLDGDRLTGAYDQAGRTLPFTLTRGTVAAPARPQEPQPPFPYRSEDVTLTSGDVTLAGTLTLPDGDGPHPGIALITGSGAQDRDETIAGHKPFLLLADTLTRAGYAVLRTDDRGVGGSTGRLDEADYTDLAGDALAGVALLRGHPDVDPARVGLFGHSEGGYIAPLAAQLAPADVAFVIAMAGPAVSGEEVVVRQQQLIGAQAGVPPEQLATQEAYVRELVDLARAGDLDGARALARETLTALPPGQRPADDQLDAQVEAQLALIPFLLHDPAPSLSALRVPVLAFFGERDLQVPPGQSEAPMRALLAGNPDATVVTLPGLNHLMQPTETGDVTEYGTIETTLAPEALDLVTGWLRDRF
ncbi:alpha/beta fold hydrolase [Pseudonocardia sp.]|uniref:alpha/beta hydrolase family protein n=1 Tax=Pseudonocardia sp. TaxID=60912 RepID=UPI00260DAADF|nr:alpha/beta fold hydrolase [Pseudonocardia sp.]